VKPTRRAFVVAVVGAAVLVGASGSAAAKPLISGKPEIKLVTRTTHAGPHPVLQWKAANGATLYLVVVQSTKGVPYWTWQGDATTVRFGGASDSAPKRSEGATLARKMQWFVVAMDAQGSPIASSAKQKIAP
jgi:hypothetical protein